MFSFFDATSPIECVDIPPQCKLCPELDPHVQRLQMLHVLSDHAIEQAVDTEKRDELIAALSEEELRAIGNLFGEDNEGAEDPKVIIDRMTSATYDSIKKQLEFAERIVTDNLEACGDQGTTTARVPHETGSVLVRLCGASIVGAHPGHDHSSIVSIRREAKQ